MLKRSEIIYSPATRKIKTIVFSIFYSMSGQLSNIVLSALTVYFLSKEFWGEYSRIILSVTFYLVFCSWGSREYLTTAPHATFRSSLWDNVVKRSWLLLPAALLLFFTSGHYALVSVLFLFLRFMNSSYEILIYKEKKFRTVLAYELLFMLLFMLLIFFFRQQIAGSFSLFLIIPLGLEFLRTISYTFIFKLMYPLKYSIGEAYRELKASFPFFINALVGLCASRGDSLLALFYFNNTQLASYQVAFNFVFLFQALSNFIFYTYSFHFYRLSVTVKSRLIKKYITLGMFISVIFYVTTYILFQYWYRIGLSLPAHLLLTGFVLLSFIHQPYIYLIYQQKKTILISSIGVISMAVFLVFLLGFNSFFPQHVFYNFLFSAFVAQLFRSLAFYFTGRTILKIPVSENKEPA